MVSYFMFETVIKMFDFDNNGKMDFMEFAIGTGMFDPNSPLNKQNHNEITRTTISNNAYTPAYNPIETIYWPDGTSFTGEIRNGICWNGKGVVKYEDDAFYIGEVANGKRHGMGTYYWPERTFFKGEFHNNKMWTGNGTVKYDNGDKYQGDLKDGIPHGYGTYYWSDNSSFVGEFLNGNCWTGNGTVKYTNGDMYIGERVNGKNHGFGVQYIADFGEFKGNWINGEMNGQGAVYQNDGCYFIGEFRNGHLWNGKAKIKGDNEFNEGILKDGIWECVNVIPF